MAYCKLCEEEVEDVRNHIYDCHSDLVDDKLSEYTDDCVKEVADEIIEDD